MYHLRCPATLVKMLGIYLSKVLPGVHCWWWYLKYTSIFFKVLCFCLSKINLQKQFFRRVLLVCHKNKWRDLSQKTCHFYVFVYWRGTRKHFHWSKKYFRPIRMFSCPPSTNKNKEVTCFCDKSRHLFLWQTNRIRLMILFFNAWSITLSVWKLHSNLQSKTAVLLNLTPNFCCLIKKLNFIIEV